MALYIASLNSGSNGNCYYVGSGQDAVLVDAGISCRETERRMKRLDLDITRVRAIFISHEHIDHISGLRVLSKKYQLPVYITPATERSGNLALEKNLVRPFVDNSIVTVGSLTVIPFTKEHDADDPHSFVIASAGIRVGVFTDIGIACERLTHHFKHCHAAFLEANYDRDMLMNGDYPAHLKKRISGGVGHLSNDQALELFKRHRPAFMTHLVLSHLSQNNNKPEIVDQLFQKHAGETTIIVASRYQESEVYTIDGEPVPVGKAEFRPRQKPTQLSLF
jgi:phosphoribosyl 1,2-cyclic phosphodiesterase